MRTPMLKYHYLLLILCSVPFKLLATSPIESNGLADFTDFSDIGVEITPSLAINYKYDDNIANVSSNKTASKLVEIIPALRIVGQKYNNQFTLNYAANKNLYSESESSNFTDHQLQAGIKRAVNRRHTLALLYQFEQGHDAPNTGISEGSGQVAEPAVFYTQNIDLNYRYGSQSSTVTLTPRIRFNNKRYDEDNLNYTTAADFNEYDYGLAIYYRLAASVNLLVDMSHITTNYEDTNDSKDKDNANALIYSGINWDITGKTQGVIKLGYEEINFADNRRTTQANPSWDMGIRWSPKTYSIFNISVSQKIRNAITGSDSIETNNQSINWQHTWRYNLSSSLAYNHLDEVYQQSERNDDSHQLNMALNYQFRRWLTFGLSYEYQNKSSSDSRLAYDKNIYGLTSNFVF
ncbi:outer membrane beta-barrel protein [Moritella marina ATCC 15381]|uniref:Outer membrane beta-barrel protein n=2 Tax=Moritella marina TaxID=90736 RepID=A0A5J6WQU2_MORMI|nr:outer membrane beta-barrel protein [Moritella marina ATCC 15381]